MNIGYLDKHELNIGNNDIVKLKTRDDESWSVYLQQVLIGKEDAYNNKGTLING